MKLSVFTASLCLSLLQLSPAIALSRDVSGGIRSIHHEFSTPEFSGDAIISQRPRRSKRAPSVSRQPGLKRTPQRRRTIQRRPASTSIQRTRSSQPSRKRNQKRLPSRSAEARKVQPSPIQSTPRKKAIRSKGKLRPKLRTGSRDSRTVDKSKSRSAPKKLSVKDAQPQNAQSKTSKKRRAPSIKVIPKKLSTSRRKKNGNQTKSRQVVPSRHKVNTFSKHRLKKVVRRPKSVATWGSRRVRSRRLTRSYRPCYYCPGIGWSYSPRCYTRPRRYYVYSGSYPQFWPGIGSHLGLSHRFNRNQSLAKQIEEAIDDYATLYKLETLADSVEVRQEGSVIILSGEVESEETLEDLVAIARDTEGVISVITEDLIVTAPREQFEDNSQSLPPDINFDEQLQTLSPELVFSVADE